MYKEDIDIIKNICKNNNVNVDFELLMCIVLIMVGAMLLVDYKKER